MSECLYCHKKLSGRVDKKYCDHYCKSSYHAQKRKQENDSLFTQIDKQLKTNRKILRHFNKEGKTIIEKQKLLDLNFNPDYYTHTTKSNDKTLYYRCYEYGYYEKKQKKLELYVIVHF